MALSKEAIQEFKEIYKKEFKEDISDDKAQELGQNLIDLFRIIYRPLPNKEKLDPGLDTLCNQRDDGP